MSGRKGRSPAAQETYPWGHPLHGKPYIRVTDHDVLAGRGVNIAQHAGNERFRALVNSRRDINYCHAYTTAEKRAVAEEIVAHIKSLNPPGRFLRLSGRSGRSSRGLEGPWEELSKEEEIKKACQALRDCNRQDRTGYAAAVAVPEDVHYSEHLRLQSGMTNKQYAELAAAQAKQEAEKAAAEVKEAVDLGKRAREEHEAGLSSDDMEPTPIGETTSIIDAAVWLKKQRSDVTPIPYATPATAGSSGGMSSLQDNSEHNQHHHHMLDDYSPVAAAAATLLSSHLDHNSSLPASPAMTHAHPFHDPDDLGAHFEDDDDTKPSAASHYHHSNSNDLVDPLHLAAEAAAAIEGGHHHHPLLSSSGGVDQEDFGPPSPLHPDHHHDDVDDLHDHPF
jgi:hypothetical protein